MVKHTQTIRQHLPTNCLSVFDHSVTIELIKISLFFKKFANLRANNSRILRIKKAKLSGYCFIITQTFREIFKLLNWKKQGLNLQNFKNQLQNLEILLWLNEPVASH